jgi:hypothetical protein
VQSFFTVALEAGFPTHQLILQKLLNSSYKFKQVNKDYMLKRKQKNPPPPVDNTVSDETGSFDLRFMLWRRFCEQNNISVETLPSQLNSDQKEKWDELKANRLRRPIKK